MRNKFFSGFVPEDGNGCLRKSFNVGEWWGVGAQWFWDRLIESGMKESEIRALTRSEAIKLHTKFKYPQLSEKMREDVIAGKKNY